MGTNISVNSNNQSLFSKGIVESKLKVSSNQMDLIAILLAEIGKPTDNDNNLEYSINIEDYAQLNNINTDTARKILYSYIVGKDDRDSLRHIGFELYREDGSFEHYNWFEKIIYTNGVATFFMTKDIKKILVDFKKSDQFKVYTKLRYILPMKSVYSKRIYLMCREFIGSGKRFCDTDWDLFTEKLQIPRGYRYQHIKNQILDKAVEEINETTDITISYEIKEENIRGGKKPVAIIFNIISKVDTLESDNPTVDEDITKGMEDKSLDFIEDQIQKLMALAEQKKQEKV